MDNAEPQPRHNLRAGRYVHGTTKSLREIGMDNIRLKITVNLAHNHALTFQDLETLKPVIERGIAACLPHEIAVDTIKVTRIKEGAPAAQPPFNRGR